MPFTYPQVTISYTNYNVYIDTADATSYLVANISSASTSWLQATPMVQDQTLVSATRWLDAANWMGQKSDPTNALDFPRTGLVYPDGTPVDPATLPLPLVEACAELAAMLADNPDLRTELQDPLPKSLAAGSVRIEYFRPLGTSFGAKDVQTLSFFPTPIMNLIGIWLGGSSGLTTSAVTTGTKRRPALDRPFDFIHGF